MPVTTPGEAKDVELVGSWFYVKLDNGIEGFFTDASGFGYEVEVVEKTDTKHDTRTRKRTRKTTRIEKRVFSSTTYSTSYYF